MTDVLGYYRLSHSGGSSKQEIQNKITKQKDSVHEHCEEADKNIVEEFEETDVSARKMAPWRRPKFRELLLYARENKDIDEIIVHHPDRITRQPACRVALLEIINAVCRFDEDSEDWIKVYASGEAHNEYLDDYGYIDSSEGIGEFVTIAVQGASSFIEHQKSNEKTQEKLQKKRDKGQPVGRQPKGITTDKQHPEFDTDEATLRVPDPDNMDRFDVAMSVIDYISSNGGEIGEDGAGSAYSIGKQFDLSSPTNYVKRIWRNKDKYRDAEKNRAKYLS